MNIEKIRKKSEKACKRERRKRFKELVRKCEEEICNCLVEFVAYPSTYSENRHTIEAVCGYFISKGFTVVYDKDVYFLTIKW